MILGTTIVQFSSRMGDMLYGSGAGEVELKAEREGREACEERIGIRSRYWS